MRSQYSRYISTRARVKGSTRDRSSGGAIVIPARFSLSKKKKKKRGNNTLQPCIGFIGPKETRLDRRELVYARCRLFLSLSPSTYIQLNF